VAATLGLTGPAAAQTVTIKREALSITDPKEYNIPLRTVPAKSLDLSAPYDGVVRSVLVEAGKPVSAQAEAIRFDDTRQRLLLDRAKANVQAAKAELKIAEGKGGDVEAAAQARLDAAQADLKLAELDVEKTIVKAPFSGEVFRVHVLPGQFVRGGEPLVTVADTSSLLVEIPADRLVVTKKPDADAKKAVEVELLVESTPVRGKVQAVLPPAPRFDPLRNIVPALVTAVVQIDNPKKDLLAGQTVYTKLIPQHPFALVPTTAVSNQADGKRKVQVLRQGTVRDIPVDILTQKGTEEVFVAGTFLRGDEVIVTSSQPLADGQQVKQQTEAATAAASTPNPAGQNPAPVKPSAAKTTTGF
jgi:membrane fusion protein (multidrug efflux system)